MDNDVIYKVLLLGDATVGKTCFLIQFTDKVFIENHITTIGLDYRLKTMTLKDEKKIKLQIWDTAGQDRFRAITRNYYKSAHGVILIYDVTSKDTFLNIKKWIASIKDEAQKNIVIFIVGNKIDLPEKRKVTTQEGKELAEKYGLPFFETSAKTGDNVKEIFNDIAEKVDQIFYKTETEVKTMKKSKTNVKDKRTCC